MAKYLGTNLHDFHQLSSILRSSSSSSNSSLSSQSSLPSIPSLTPPLLDHSLTAGAASTNRCLATLQGHSSYIFSLALAGKCLYSGASDGEIRAWDLIGNSFQSTTVVGGCSAVKSILVAGDKLISAHHDHTIRVWRNDNFSSSANQQQRYKAVAILPTLSDSFLRLFSAQNYVRVRRNKTRTWVHHNDAVSSLALTADSSLLYSVSWDRTLKIWRTSDYKCLESVHNAHDDAINAVVLSSDGCIYTASADKKIKIWRRINVQKKPSLVVVATLEKHKSAVNALALSSDGEILYSGACDRSIIIWEKKGEVEMAVAGALRGHTKAILCLATVADLVFSGSADRTVRIWRRLADSRNYSCLAVLEGHRNPVKCVTAAADGEINDSYLVYSGGLDFEIKVWQIWVPPNR